MKDREAAAMADQDVAAILEPLVEHQAFASVEEAARKLVSGFILGEIDEYREQIASLEKRYGMSFEQFSAYLKERSSLLTDGQLELQHRKRIAQAVMTEEEDWLDWKVAREFLESWLGLHAGAAA